MLQDLATGAKLDSEYPSTFDGSCTYRMFDQSLYTLRMKRCSSFKQAACEAAALGPDNASPMFSDIGTARLAVC